MTGKKIFVMIGCDTDPVIEPNQRSVFNKERVWNDTVQSIIRLKEEIEKSGFEQKNSPKITWFQRSDWQMYKIWEDWCYSSKEFKSVWREFQKSGDEIGWHPHLWRMNEKKSTWYQEIHDNYWISHCLENGYREISKIFDVKTVRMGWDFHNNFTMNTLNTLAVQCDMSAIPNIENKGTVNNIYDWTGALNRPYHPSCYDYKLEDKNKNNNLDILELPITTFPLPFYLRVLTRAKNNTTMANIAKHPVFFRNAIKMAVNSCNFDNHALAVYFHPSDIEKNKGLFSLYNFIQNLNNIVEAARKKKMEALFITPQEFRKLRYA